MKPPKPADTLLAALESLPDQATIPVGFVRQHLNSRNRTHASADLLDVKGIAAILDRSPSTARALCASGAIPNAFRLNGREWRCRTADVDAYIESARLLYAERYPVEYDALPSRRPMPLGTWRKVTVVEEE